MLSCNYLDDEKMRLSEDEMRPVSGWVGEDWLVGQIKRVVAVASR